jgi:hypothetical protein
LSARSHAHTFKTMSVLWPSLFIPSPLLPAPKPLKQSAHHSGLPSTQCVLVVEAREPTPVAYMFRPHRTRGQWGEPHGVVHKGGAQILSWHAFKLSRSPPAPLPPSLPPPHTHTHLPPAPPPSPPLLPPPLPFLLTLLCRGSHQAPPLPSAPHALSPLVSRTQ